MFISLFKKIYCIVTRTPKMNLKLNNEFPNNYENIRKKN